MSASALAIAPDQVLGELLGVVARLLTIQRPLAALDLESTGTNPELDRIVELTIVRVEPVTFDVETLHTRVNPGVPIAPEVSAIHGLTEADVATAPPFLRISPRVERLLSGADLVGFNHRRFDVRLIAAECRRVGRPHPCETARLVDVRQIFMKREPRTLAAALQFFCGEAHDGAHGTTADVIATLRVLVAQFDRYPDLPRDIDGLDAIARDPSFVDRDGKIVWRGGDACIGFGKYAGVPLRLCDPGFLQWMTTKDFPADTKAIVQQALRGTYPAPHQAHDSEEGRAGEGDVRTAVH